MEFQTEFGSVELENTCVCLRCLAEAVEGIYSFSSTGVVVLPVASSEVAQGILRAIFVALPKVQGPCMERCPRHCTRYYPLQRGTLLVGDLFAERLSDSSLALEIALGRPGDTISYEVNLAWLLKLLAEAGNVSYQEVGEDV